MKGGAHKIHLTCANYKQQLAYYYKVHVSRRPRAAAAAACARLHGERPGQGQNLEKRAHE